jgi:hypothetical protein
MTEPVSFLTNKGLIEIPNRTLIVGLDETGCEDYKDNRNPVFGLGGCAVLAMDYYRHLDYPWKEIKEDYFGGAGKPLHASDLRSPNSDQLSALEDFFTRLPFFRFACMSAKDFDGKNETEESIIHLVSMMVMKQVCEFASLVQPTGIIYVIDNSERIQKQLQMHLEAYIYGNGVDEFNATVIVANKEVSASCVEVADFVVHPAGARVRNRILGKYLLRKDFELVFHRVSRHLVAYSEILSAKPIQALQFAPSA